MALPLLRTAFSPVRQLSALSIVAGSLPRPPLLLPHLCQPFRHTVAAIRGPLFDELLGLLLVYLLPLRLHIGRAGSADVRALVPFQPQPPQAAHQAVQALGIIAPAVRVLDTQNELSVGFPRPQPVKKGCPQPAQMQMPCRAGRKSNPDRSLSIVGHNLASLWEQSPGRIANAPASLSYRPPRVNVSRVWRAPKVGASSPTPLAVT